MTPTEQEDYQDRLAIILEGNPGITEAEAMQLARRCVDRVRLGYPVEQPALPWKVPA